MTTDGKLHVTQGELAVNKYIENEYVLALSCGTFAFKDDPLLMVEWVVSRWRNIY
jgi:hypothetical protein